MPGPFGSLAPEMSTDPKLQTLISRERRKSASSALKDSEERSSAESIRPGGESSFSLRASVGGLAVGEFVAERFKIERLAESGGMGDIYRARDTVTERLVAIKTLRNSFSSSSRFRREVEVLLRLRHPGIPAYVSHGTLSAGQPFLAMEWLQGRTLAQELRNHKPSLRSTLSIASGVARAVAAAHEAGIVHRDLNPNNIFLLEGSPSEVRVLDFGVARWLEEECPVTGEGTQIGTPGYMAPEQVEGHREVTPAVDVFALGCLLFELIVGERAFYAPTIQEVLARIVRDAPPCPRQFDSAVPEELSQLVLRLLEKNPAKRPQDGREVVRLLSRLPEIAEEAPRRGAESLSLVEGRELQIVSAIVLRSEQEDTFARARLAAQRYGLTAVQAAEGMVAICCSGSGTAVDHAIGAARCALCVRQVTRAQLSVATGLSGAHEPCSRGRAYHAASTALLRHPAEAKSGSSILLDESTASLIDSRYEVRRENGGYFLCGVRASYEPARTVLGRRTRCVGRRRELSMLSAMLEECIEDEVSGGVLITGPPGIGKSRLGYEVSRIARRGRTRVRVLRASADSMSRGVPYFVFAQAFQHACGIDETQATPARQARIHAYIHSLLGKADEGRIGQLLGEVLSLEGGEGAPAPRPTARNVKGEQIQRAFSRWLAAECRRDPVLLVLDDLHWADRESVQLIDELLRQHSGLPLMLVGLARPEIHEVLTEQWPWWGVTELRLGGLSRRAAGEMVNEILGEPPDEFVLERVVTRAQGNPFWLEELLKAEDAGQGEEVPDRILLLAQSRILQLEANARGVVRTGSVFGRHFWSGALRHVLGRVPGHALEKIRTQLVDASLIVKKDVSRFPDEEEFEFASGLLRDAAYSLLSEEERERAHGRAAEWLEARGHAEALPIATHYTLGGEPDRAQRHYLQAAWEALSQNAFEEALSCVQEGLASSSQGPVAVELELVGAEAARWLGDNLRCLRAAERALKWCHPGEAFWYRAMAEVGGAAAKLGKRSRCLQIGEKLLEEAFVKDAEQAENEEERTIALVRLAGELAESDRLQLAERLLDLCGGGGRRSQPAPAVGGFVYAARAELCEATCDLLGRLENIEQAADHFEDAGDLRNACIQRIQLGSARLELGDVPGAIEALSSAAQVAEQMRLSNSIPVARMHWGRALCRSGHVEEGMTLLEKSATKLDRHRNMRMSGVARLAIAEAQLARGNLDLAEDAARRAVTIFRTLPVHRVKAQALLALILLEAGEVSQASDELLSSGQSQPRHPHMGQTLVQLAKAETLVALGQQEEGECLARGEARRLKETAERMEPDVATTYLYGTPERRRVLLVAGESDGAGNQRYSGTLRCPPAKLFLDEGESGSALTFDLHRLDSMTGVSSRHLWLARTYLRLSEALASSVGSQEASFLGLSAWISRRRAQALVRAEFAESVSRQLDHDASLPKISPFAWSLLGAMGLTQPLRESVKHHLCQLEEVLSDGFIDTLRRFGPAISGFIDLLQRESSEEEINGFLATVEHRSELSSAGGFIREACEHYYEASRAVEESKRKELIRLGNARLFRAEQFSLQATLENSMRASLRDRVLRHLRQRLPPLFSLLGTLVVAVLGAKYLRAASSRWRQRAPWLLVKHSLPSPVNDIESLDRGDIESLGDAQGRCAYIVELVEEAQQKDRESWRDAPFSYQEIRRLDAGKRLPLT